MKPFVIVKYSGKVLGKPAQSQKLAKNLVNLAKQNYAVLVHGGGVEISSWLEKLDIPNKFVQGLRYTDTRTMAVVEAVLSGLVNKSWVSLINQAGGKAVGISGKDGNLIIARPIKKLGFVGEPQKVNLPLIRTLVTGGYLPVVSPVGMNNKGISLNINADLVSASLATALKANKLVFITDVSGVYDRQKKILPEIKISQIETMLKEGVIDSGMIPKIKSALKAVKEGVKEVIITNDLAKTGTRIVR